MRGAAAVTAHRNAHARRHEITGASHTIEVDDSKLSRTELESKEKTDGNEDPEYIPEEDHLYLFPPPRYRKGDISLGVLMSG